VSDGTEAYAAGRVGDPIAHSHALGGFIAGALVGVAAAVGVAVGAAMVAGAVAAEVVTAGLATPLVAGAAVVVGELAVNIFLGGWLAEKAQQIGESIGAGSHGSPSGQITVGDPGIIINDKPAAAVDSKTSCDNSTVAQGSSTVFFNGKPAARIGDKTSCGGAIIQGSGDVLIGSPPATVGSIADEVPNWVRWAAVILPLLPGIGQALRTVGKGLLAIEAQGFGRALRVGAKTVARNLEERALPKPAAVETKPAEPFDPQKNGDWNAPRSWDYASKAEGRVEPGAVPPSPELRAMSAAAENNSGVAGPEGWPDLPPKDATTFTPDGAEPVDIPGGTKLYRIVGDDRSASGSYWSYDPPPQTEGEWRAANAVKDSWNGDGGYVEHTVPDEGLKAWAGPAAPQYAADNVSMLPGQGTQVWVPRNAIAPDGPPMPTPWNLSGN
jgi:uncharacterized Zn-binding protein involved in type VI secretion